MEFACSNKKNTECSGTVDPLDNTFKEKQEFLFVIF